MPWKMMPTDGDDWPVEAYRAFWKAYEELPEGEGKWNAWAAGLTAMFKFAPEEPDTE
jgi:hypothetical protein